MFSKWLIKHLTKVWCQKVNLFLVDPASADTSWAWRASLWSMLDSIMFRITYLMSQLWLLWLGTLYFRFQFMKQCHLLKRSITNPSFSTGSQENAMQKVLAHLLKQRLMTLAFLSVLGSITFVIGNWCN